jgi:hypothetical protein
MNTWIVSGEFLNNFENLNVLPHCWISIYPNRAKRSPNGCCMATSSSRMLHFVAYFTAKTHVAHATLWKSGKCQFAEARHIKHCSLHSVRNSQTSVGALKP